MEKQDLDKIILEVSSIGVFSLVLIVDIRALRLQDITKGRGTLSALIAMYNSAITWKITTRRITKIVNEGIYEYGANAIFKGVVYKLYTQGETKESIKQGLSDYLIKKSVREKIYAKLDEVN